MQQLSFSLSKPPTDWSHSSVLVDSQPTLDAETATLVIRSRSEPASTRKSAEPLLSSEDEDTARTPSLEQRLVNFARRVTPSTTPVAVQAPLAPDLRDDVGSVDSLPWSTTETGCNSDIDHSSPLPTDLGSLPADGMVSGLGLNAVLTRMDALTQLIQQQQQSITQLSNLVESQRQQLTLVAPSFHVCPKIRT